MKPLQRRIKNFKVGDRQLEVEVYPKTKKHDRSHFDIFRITLRDASGEHDLSFDMTPDEALDIANVLSTASMVWMMNYKPYWDEFMQPKRKLTRNIRRRQLHSQKKKR